MEFVVIGGGVTQFLKAITFDYAALVVLFLLETDVKQITYSAEVLHCFRTPEF